MNLLLGHLYEQVALLHHENDFLKSLKAAVFVNLQANIYNWKKQGAQEDKSTGDSVEVNADPRTPIYAKHRSLIVPEQIRVALRLVNMNFYKDFDFGPYPMYLYKDYRETLNPGASSSTRSPCGSFLRTLTGVVTAKSKIYRKLLQTAYQCHEESCKDNHLFYQKISCSHRSTSLEESSKPLASSSSSEFCCQYCLSPMMEIVAARSYESFQFLQARVYGLQGTPIEMQQFILTDDQLSSGIDLGQEFMAVVIAQDLLLHDGRPNSNPTFTCLSVDRLKIPYALNQYLLSEPTIFKPAPTLLSQLFSFYDVLPGDMFREKSLSVRELVFYLYLSLLSPHTPNPDSCDEARGLSILVITEEAYFVQAIMRKMQSFVNFHSQSCISMKFDNLNPVKTLSGHVLNGCNFINSSYKRISYVDLLLDLLPAKDLKWLYSTLSSPETSGTSCWAVCSPNFKYLPKNILERGAMSKLNIFNITSAFDVVLDLTGYKADRPIYELSLMEASFNCTPCPFANYLKVG